MARADNNKSEEVITAKNVDLSSCDRELIQYPAAIQPHGLMLTVDERSNLILQATENCASLLGRNHDEVIGKEADSVFGQVGRYLLGKLDRMSLDNGPVHVAGDFFIGRDLDFNLFAHSSGGLIILELEVASSISQNRAVNLYAELRSDIASLQATTNLRDFLHLAVHKIRSFTGYDRVMAYRFDEDGSGHVVAESKWDELESYLDLHYPASDIPTPARRLFAMSWLRHLPDVNYRPVPLLPATNPQTGDPVDMSFAMLRSVSVMYTDYLKNMGVKSTMVMPLMKEGKLWGLVSAMHHSGPRHIPYEVRVAAEFLSHTLSLLMSAKADAEVYERRIAMAAKTETLIVALNNEPNFRSVLTAPNILPEVLEQVEATGAAVVTGSYVSVIGNTPTEMEIGALAQWIGTRSDTLIATDRLSSLFPPAKAYAGVASGLLGIRISSIGSDFIFWFRQEQIAVVSWAGDPRKPVEVNEVDGEMRLRPRGSFELWKESVRERATPWHDNEIASVLKLRHAIGEVLLRRANEIERLNRELQASNAELDSFAHVVSHDLKEPLRGIHHLATFLKLSQGNILDSQGQEQLAGILRLTQRMDALLDAILEHSRLGRTTLAMDVVDLDEIVDSVLPSFEHLLSQSGTEVRRPCRLGSARGERMRISEVFANLIGNALKYNENSVRRIEIGAEAGHPPRYYVRDNGIGIAELDHQRIFQIFHRLHGRDEYGGGTGVGLAIVRKIVERHGGRIWVHSVPEQGSTFYFTLEPSPKD
jgi:chemotaxis family two-component system sensor kinase Cph1